MEQKQNTQDPEEQKRIEEECQNELSTIIYYRLEKQREERDKDAKKNGFNLLLLGEDLNSGIIGMELYYVKNDDKEYKGRVESYHPYKIVPKSDPVIGDYQEITSYKITFTNEKTLIVDPKQKLYFTPMNI